MIRLDDKGLVPAIAQDAATGEVLMLGYVSPGSLKRTLEGGQVWFYSRSRQELWHKGEVSGHFLNLKGALMDCDGDTLLLKVDPTGPACHTGNKTCFFQGVEQPLAFEHSEVNPGVLQEIFSVIQERRATRPEGSYTVRLLDEGKDRIAQKVVEEAGETAIAAVKGDKEELIREMADLWYHNLVLLSATGLTPEALWQELRSRQK